MRKNARANSPVARRSLLHRVSSPSVRGGFRGTRAARLANGVEANRSRPARSLARSLALSQECVWCLKSAGHKCGIDVTRQSHRVKTSKRKRLPRASAGTRATALSYRCVSAIARHEDEVLPASSERLSSGKKPDANV